MIWLSRALKSIECATLTRFIDTYNFGGFFYYNLTRGDITTESDSALYYSDLNDSFTMADVPVLVFVILVKFLDTYFSSDEPVLILTALARADYY